MRVHGGSELWKYRKVWSLSDGKGLGMEIIELRVAWKNLLVYREWGSM